MRKLSCLLFLATAVLSASAQDLVLTLLVSPEPHAAGRTMRLEIAGLNPGVRDVPFSLDADFTGTLAWAGQRVPVALAPAGAAPVAVPAGGFAVQRFDLRLPDDLAGQAVLTIPRTGGPPLQAVLEAGADTSAPGKTGGLSTLDRLAAAAPASSALARSFGGRFLPNQPIYFLYGDADQAAKFQFSFDYRLATLDLGRLDGAGSTTLRVGYTQRSVWDIDGASSPFYDTSYMPELALHQDAPLPATAGAFTWMGWRAGVQHESNGKEGSESRSLNTFYVRPRFVLGTLGQWAFVMLPELQAYLGNSSENDDIDDYRGYGKLRFYFGHNKGPTLLFTGWAGKDLNHGTWQVDLAVPMRLRWLNLESYVYAQYFNGYGESLRDYRRKSDAVRFGVALVR